MCDATWLLRYDNIMSSHDYYQQMRTAQVNTVHKAQNYEQQIEYINAWNVIARDNGEQCRIDSGEEERK